MVGHWRVHISFAVKQVWFIIELFCKHDFCMQSWKAYITTLITALRFICSSASNRTVRSGLLLLLSPEIVGHLFIVLYFVQQKCYRFIRLRLRSRARENESVMLNSVPRYAEWNWSEKNTFLWSQLQDVHMNRKQVKQVS